MEVMAESSGSSSLSALRDQNGQMLQDDQLQFGDVIWVNPVLCGFVWQSFVERHRQKSHPWLGYL